jgi:hypothetical protein
LTELKWFRDKLKKLIQDRCAEDPTETAAEVFRDINQALKYHCIYRMLDFFRINTIELEDFKSRVKDYKKEFLDEIDDLAEDFAERFYKDNKNE